MKAVILAAGLGLRLRPLIQDYPKCLLEVKGETLLHRQLRFLDSFGFEEIVLVLGYKHERVQERLNRSDVRVVLNPNFETTNNMVSLALTRPFVFREDFLLINGDVLFCERTLKTILETSGSVCPYDSGNFDPEALKLLIREGKSDAILPKKTGPDQSHGATIGMFKFSSEASELMFDKMDEIIHGHGGGESKGKKNEWFEMALSQIFSKTFFQPLDISGQAWIEIDNEEDWERAKSDDY